MAYRFVGADRLGARKRGGGHRHTCKITSLAGEMGLTAAPAAATAYATKRNLNPDAIGLRPVDDPSFGNFRFKHPFVEADITRDDTGDKEERVLLSAGHSLGRTPREIVHFARAGK